VQEKLFNLILILVALLIAAVLAARKAEAQELSKQEIKKLIIAEAIKQQVDPVIALAVAKVESDFNPNAVGSVGEIGVYQLRPEFHDVKKGDVKHNVKVGVRYLKRMEAVCREKYKDAWYVCYNTGPNRTKPVRAPYEFPYTKKVKRAKREVLPYVVGN